MGRAQEILQALNLTEQDGRVKPHHPRIIIDPAILVGRLVIKGTRLSVELVIGLLADGWAEAGILRNYPGLQREDITACLAYARDLLDSEWAFPSAA